MKKFLKKVGTAASKIAEAADEAIEDFKNDKDEKMAEALSYIRENGDSSGLCPLCGAYPEHHAENEDK